MSTYKKFNEQLFHENDVQARLAALSYLDSQGMYAVENDDRYGPDLVVYRGLTPAYYVEVEIKSVWKPHSLADAAFPWDSVQLPARKKKFIQLGLPCEFWILRADLKFALIIPDYLLSDGRLVEVPNRYIEQGEYFYQIPISECILIQLGEQSNA